METASFLTQALSLFTLLIISSFTYILSKKINFPYTVLLVLIWLLLVPISNISIFSFIDDFRLTPDVLFFVFLPILLFESSYNINYRLLLKNWKTISALSIFWLFISAFIIAFSLFYLLPIIWLKIPFLVCLLFWVLISATDPVAVLSIFKKMWAPKRLTILFEWESLFNDWTAVALFLVVLWIIFEWWIIDSQVYLSWIWKFSSMLFWWIMFWTFFWVLFSKILWYIKNNEEVEIVLTMVMAHLTFILSELVSHHFNFLPISWVISTVIASIIIWNYWRYKITPKVEAHMQKFWELFAFVSNSLVFILMWLILSWININFSIFVYPVIITIFIVMIARAISVYIPIWFINFLRLEKHIPKSWQTLLSWWSLRWALAIMMVLMIPWEWDLNYEKILAFQNFIWWSFDFWIKDFLTVLTISCVMFTLFVKAPTISFMMKKFWVDKLYKIEEFEYFEWKILVNLKILEKINKLYEKSYLNYKEYNKLLWKYSQNLKDSVNNMKNLITNNNKSSQILLQRAISLHALWIEKNYLKILFLHNEIDERNFKYILRKITKQIERVESEKPQLREISNREDDYDIFQRLAIYLYKNSSSDVDTYIRNRTRVIITRKVIKELKELSKIDFWFDNSIFEETIEIYKNFNNFAENKKVSILCKNPKIIKKLEIWLLSKSLLNLEENLLNDFYNKEIITQKLYLKFKEEVEENIYSDVKKALL